MSVQSDTDSHGPATILRDMVCVGCGSLCDDLTLTVQDNRVTAVAPPCPVAEAFFLAARQPPRAACLVDGRPAEVDAALDRAADILQAAAAPLVMGLERATTETQRIAIEIADRLSAVIDPTDEQGASRSHAAMQTVGAAAATWGEIAARADLVIYWNGDPARTHPRHLERFARRPLAVPGQPPARRRVVAVAARRSATSELVDEFLQLGPGSDVAALWTLRALVRGVAVDDRQVAAQTGAPLEQWQYLAERLKLARYAAIFFAPPVAGGDDPEALSQGVAELVRDLHRVTRAVAAPLAAAPNVAGAAQALTWQSGFPAGVDFSAGFPTYRPGECSAGRLLERGEVDAALVIASDPLGSLNPAARSHFESIPTIVLDDCESDSARAAAVALFSSVFGVETTGSVYRGDGVALPLRAALQAGRPSAEAILERLLARLS